MDSSIFIWNLQNKQFVHNLTGHRDLITSLSVDKDKNLLASSSWDTLVNIYDISEK